MTPAARHSGSHFGSASRAKICTSITEVRLPKIFDDRMMRGLFEHNKVHLLHFLEVEAGPLYVVHPTRPAPLPREGGTYHTILKISLA